MNYLLYLGEFTSFNIKIKILFRQTLMKIGNQEPKPFKAGEIIYSHNDPAEFIFLIHSGKVRIESKHGLELGVLETGEIFVKWDEASDEEWLLLIYIKNNSPEEGIVIEDKTNPEKNISHEFKNNEIFKASDTMVDALTQLISRKRAKIVN